MSTNLEPRQMKKGRGRGILSLSSKPPSRPGAKSSTSPNNSINGKLDEVNKTAANLSLNNESVTNSSTENNTGHVNKKSGNDLPTSGFKNQDVRNDTVKITNSNSAHSNESSGVCTSRGGMIAKYNYKAVPGGPGGFPELTVKQGEKLKLIRKGHEETQNWHWWEVTNEKGEQGFVPAKYCMVIEEKPSALPWLESKRIEEEKEEKKRLAEVPAVCETRKVIGFGMPANYTAPIKQYVSSYNGKEPAARNAAEANKEFYCEICDKNLNGPTPYKMHMNSKAHKEYVEYENSKNQY